MVTGEQLRRKIKAAGLNMEDVIEKCGVSRGTFYSYLNRSTLPVQFLNIIYKNFGDVLELDKSSGSTDNSELEELQNQLKQKDRIINTLLEQIEDLRKQNAGSGHKAKAI